MGPWEHDRLLQTPVSIKSYVQINEIELPGLNEGSGLPRPSRCPVQVPKEQRLEKPRTKPQLMPPIGPGPGPKIKVYSRNSNVTLAELLERSVSEAPASLPMLCMYLFSSYSPKTASFQIPTSQSTFDSQLISSSF